MRLLGNCFFYTSWYRLENPLERLAYLQHWMTYSPCLAHIVHRSMKTALQYFVRYEKGAYRDLWIGSSALRNGYIFLVDAVLPFIHEFKAFRVKARPIWQRLLFWQLFNVFMRVYNQGAKFHGFTIKDIVMV